MSNQATGKLLYEALQSQERAEWPDDWADLSPYWKGVYQRTADALLALVQPAVSEEADKWTLTAPGGRKWHGDSGLQCATAEQRERVPAKLALERIYAAVDAFEAEDRAAIAAELEPHAIRASACPPDSMVVPQYSIRRLFARAQSSSKGDEGMQHE